MQQYFIENKLEVNAEVVFNPEQSHHIKNVLRMKSDTTIRLVDSLSNAYYASIFYRDSCVLAKVKERILKSSESKIQITLYMGLIKGEKWDYLIQKACECGVHTIVPLLTSRCVVKVKTEKNDRKRERWNKIAMEACEQCKRTHMVEVLDPVELKDLKKVDGLGLIAYEDADFHSANLAACLKGNNATHIAIVIGPEGGFSPQEVARITDLGYQCVSLGERILRAETAALFTLNAIVYHFDLLGELYESIN